MEYEQATRYARDAWNDVCKVLDLVRAMDPGYPRFHVEALLTDTCGFLGAFAEGGITKGHRALATNLLQAVELLEKAGPANREMCQSLVHTIEGISCSHLAIEGYNLDPKRISPRTR